MGPVTTEHAQPATGPTAVDPPAPGLEEIYDRYATDMYAYARFVTRSAAQAEDVVQESFVRLAQRELKGVSNLRGYVLGVVRNEALRQLGRWERWRRRDQLAGELELEESAACDPERRDEALRIQRAMATLPPAQREVVFLKVWRDLTFAAIGEALGVPANTAASRYRYGTAKLRQELGQ